MLKVDSDRPHPGTGAGGGRSGQAVLFPFGIETVYEGLTEEKTASFVEDAGSNRP